MVQGFHNQNVRLLHGIRNGASFLHRLGSEDCQPNVAFYLLAFEDDSEEEVSRITLNIMLSLLASID